MTRNLIILLGFSLMISYCKRSSTESEMKPLLKTLWTLESFDVSGEITKPSEDQVFNIKFLEDGTFSAKSDCNEITGHYTVNSDNTIKADSIAATKVYCGQESLDKKYYDALHIIKSYKVTNDKLQIYYGNNEKLNYYAQ